MLSFRPLNAWSSRCSPNQHPYWVVAGPRPCCLQNLASMGVLSGVFCCDVLLQELDPSTTSHAGKPRVIGWSARPHRGVACVKPTWRSATDEGAQSISSLPTPAILILAILQLQPRLFIHARDSAQRIPTVDRIAPREAVTDANAFWGLSFSCPCFGLSRP